MATKWPLRGDVDQPDSHSRDSHSLDLLGVKPVADAFNAATQAAIDGASAFLSRICLPAAEEFGFLLQDTVKGWRARNLFRTTKKTERILGRLEGQQAHPRVVAQIVEHSSWTDADDIQEMWAGLLASSCTEDGTDESGLIFVDLLSRMTAREARILRLACQKAKPTFAAGGELFADNVIFWGHELRELVGLTDDYTLQREIAHLHSLELMKGQFSIHAQKAILMPSELGLHLFARSSGHRGDPATSYGLARTTG
jgi:abortive infection alpha-like protein